MNKAFGIGFGTFPSDDTGVFHILEHSVLAGSEKYPVTSPFLHLLWEICKQKARPEQMQGLHKTVFAKAPAMGKIWRDFGHAFSFASSSSRGIYPSPSYLIWMCCTRFPLDLSGAST